MMFCCDLFCSKGQVHKTCPLAYALAGDEEFCCELQTVVRNLRAVDVEVLESSTEVTDLVLFDSNLQNLVCERKPVAVRCDAVIAVRVVALNARRLDDLEAQEFSHEPFDHEIVVSCRNIQNDTCSL